jgi:SacI homology domain
MPGLVRKLLVCASVNGLVVQAHGPVDHHKAIQIDYKTRRIRDCSADDATKYGKDTSIEVHGLIGVLSFASSSFLIAITRREQVAQIFGKPVYVITDVAFLPLSSRSEAVQAINTAAESRRSRDASTESELSDSDAEDTATSATADKTGSSPVDEEHFPPQSSRTDTNIAQDVFAKRGQFGRFASQWFSKQGWGVGRSTGHPQTVTAPADQQADLGDRSSDPVEEGEAGESQAMPTEADTAVPSTESQEQTPVAAMIPKILRVSRLILASSSFFFSYELDLTRSMASLSGSLQAPVKGNLNPLVSERP